MAENVHKVTLSTGKVVLLKDFKIKYQRLAAQAAGHTTENVNVLSLAMTEELVKILVVQIDDKPVTGAMMEDLDSLFVYAEYSQIAIYIQKMMGAGQEIPKSEIVNTGALSPGSAATPA